MSILQSIAASIRAKKRKIRLYWPARNRGTGAFRKILKSEVSELRHLYGWREREQARQKEKQVR